MLCFIRTPLLREFYHNTASRKKPRQYYPVPLPRPCVHYFLGFSKLEQIVPVIFPPAVVLIWKKLAKRINSKYLALWQKIIVDSLCICIIYLVWTLRVHVLKLHIISYNPGFDHFMSWQKMLFWDISCSLSKIYKPTYNLHIWVGNVLILSQNQFSMQAKIKNIYNT